jgi:hypothetical protein
MTLLLFCLNTPRILKVVSQLSRLGSEVVSVLATGPKGRCSNPTKAMDF